MPPFPPASFDDDPRPPPTDEPPVEMEAPLRPSVARRVPNSGLAAIGAGAGALGVLAFAVLAVHRPPAVRNAAGVIDPAVRPVVGAAAVPPPSTTPDFSSLELAARGQAPIAAAVSPAPSPIVPPVAPPVPVVTPAPAVKPAAGEAIDPAQRQKAPTLVVDLAEGPPSSPPGGGGQTAGAVGAPGALAAAKGGPSGQPALNADEQFAARVETAAEPERVRASMLRNQSSTIAQGTVIPGVLETALNSDLPGFARAVVSRDVRGFDGSTVLIPRGSHVIGQYKSGVALGASRAFVIWSRVIRPDGASVQIGSSGTDQLGRAGLEGEVNRHFFQRFGGAILLSVINAGITSLTRSPSTSVVIGSSSEATGLASSALSPTNISPTIKVAQGAPIRIFVARDLDFSPVQRLSR